MIEPKGCIKAVVEAVTSGLILGESGRNEDTTTARSSF